MTALPFDVRSVLPFLALLLAAPASAQLIVLDPGHGGSDPGAVGCEGLREAPNVLDIGTRTRTLLEAEGLRVEMTRDTDRAVGLSARASFANGLGADLYVSIHSNANGGTPATGTETFVANSASSTSVTMCGYLQQEMLAAWGLRDRGLKRANFTVITSTRMPAALTEVCFTNRCDPDAALLRSGSGRQEMAVAHARAIMRTLGRDPDDIGGGGTTPTMGTLRGVVFEDVGVGLEDTTRRIGAARVTIGSMGAMAVDPDTGHFSVMIAPGSRTVTATAAGYEMASRTCDVTAGGETWCSVGLVASGPPPPPPMEDAGAPPPPPPTEDAGAPPPPPPTPDAGPTDPEGPDRPDGTEGCGCRTAGAPGSGGAGWLLLLALGAMLRWRRRSIAGAATVAALSLSLVGCGEPPAPTAAPLEETHAAAPTVAPHAVRVDRLASITDLAPAGEGLTAPVVSADGTRVAMASPDFEQLWLVEHGAAAELVAEGPRVGYRPVFRGDALRYRHADQTPTAVPHYAMRLDGLDLPTPTPRGWVRTDDAHQVVLTLRGQAPRVISPDGDRYLLPQLAADGAHVAFWGMETGVFLYRVTDGALVALGDGGHPSFDDTGRWLVYDRTEDEGHVLTAGELWIADTRSYRHAPLTATPDVIERMPSLGAGTIAFVTDEGVLTGRLVVD